MGFEPASVGPALSVPAFANRLLTGTRKTLTRSPNERRADAIPPWFGRWALVATADESDLFRATIPAYMEAAVRVRAEDLPSRARAAERAELLALADALR